MTTTKGNTNGPARQTQITPQRRGAGIILAVFSIVFLLGTGAAQRAQAQTFTLLHSFSGKDGADPYAGLVMDSHGNLYGTTELGGASTICSHGCGTVFKLDTSGTLTVLHSFSASDGLEPFAGLVRDSDGNLYGTTVFGGSLDYGTVFKLNSSGGGFAVLHNFPAGPNDGVTPFAGLVRDDGNLYGTTVSGGFSGIGTVFKLNSSGSDFAVLHSFAGGANDGQNPNAGLVRDSYGNLYGTTVFGGSSTYGTVFKLDTSGTLTLLHNFSGSDGQNPYAGLVRDSYGNLYGTTVFGGSSNQGTVFVISTTPQGAAAVIVTQVNGLLAQGVINKGQDNSLVKKLQNAVSLIIASKIEGAIGNLEGFINEVNDLENSGVLTGDQGSALTSAAQSVIAQLI
jgi:uncharacterized repeat protein (TIGR03803 family)